MEFFLFPTAAHSSEISFNFLTFFIHFLNVTSSRDAPQVKNFCNGSHGTKSTSHLLKLQLTIITVKTHSTHRSGKWKLRSRIATYRGWSQS